MSNKNARGGSWTAEQIAAVWLKGKIIPGVDPKVKRQDLCGAWIEFKNYGQTTTGGTGWEIDHIKPVAKGGGDDTSNLQPLQWENNRGKGDDFPNWTCATKAKT